MTTEIYRNRRRILLLAFAFNVSDKFFSAQLKCPDVVWAAAFHGATPAAPKLEKANAMEAPPFVAAYLGYAYGVAGDTAKALAMVEQIKKKRVSDFVPPFNLALVYLGIGNHTRALDYLEQAKAADSQWMMYLKVDRVFDPLRTDPRFVALMKNCHFDQ
jgi:tetratricopeptide (TPR) repeat protein